MELTGVIAACDRARQECLQTVAAIPEDFYTRSPDADSWTILQVLEHLAIVEELSLAYLQKKTRDPNLAPAPLWSGLRMLQLKFVLTSPIRVRAPLPQLLPGDSNDFAAISQRWEQASGALASFSAQLPDEIQRKAVYKHALAGYLNIRQMFGFVSSHTKNHQRQIQRIYRKLQAVA